MYPNEPSLDSVISKLSIRCSLGTRASTDIVTNTTFFPEIELSKNLDAIYRLGGFPKSHLSSFLHEAVHHWCFFSPLGSALALLQLRAFLHAFEWTEEANNEIRKNIKKSLVENLWRYTALSFLLRPLDEGLAMFAEFDVYPHPATSVVSRPMQWLYLAFTTPHEQELTNNSMEALIKILSQMRLNESFIRHKTDLFLNPISVNYGGYLSGYLFVKNLWHFAKSKSKRFTDPDLFYLFLKRYFYNDYAFIGWILLDQFIGLEAINRISSYFQNRIINFQNMDFEAEAKSCEEFTFMMEKIDHIDPMIDYPPINVNPELYYAGKDVFKVVLDQFSNPMFFNVPDNLHKLHTMILAQRHILWIGSLTVMLKPISDTLVEVIHAGKVCFELPPLNQWKPLETQGTLDLYLSLSDAFLVTTISVNTKVVLLDFRGGITSRTSAIRDEIKKYVADRVVLNNIYANIKTNFDVVIEMLGLKRYLDSNVPLFTEHVDGIYSPWTSFWVGESQKAIWDELMKRDGLLSLVNGNLELLKYLALFGLSQSLQLTDEEVAKYIPKKKLGLSEAIDELEACSYQHGYKFLIRSGENFIFTTV